MKNVKTSNTWFPVLLISEDKQQIFTVNSQEDMPKDNTVYNIFEVNVKFTEIEYGDYIIKVNGDGYIYALHSDGLTPVRVDVLEDFALMILVNTLPLDKVIELLQSGWGKIGCLKENQDKNIGFFGPIPSGNNDHEV